MTQPTQLPFVYDRRYPPLYFSKPNDTEENIWNESTAHITREYFRVSRKFHVSCETPLTNGMTTGEFAMFILTQNHQKRTQEL
jgi:hypothetical protein